MAEELIAKLRSENASLISELKKGVSKLQIYVDGEKNKALTDLKIQTYKQSDKPTARTKLDFRPSSNKKEKNKRIPKPQLRTGIDYHCNFSRDPETVVTSTPMAQKTALESEGNIRRKSTKATRTPDRCNFRNPENAQGTQPKSILRTPDARKVSYKIQLNSFTRDC